MLKSLQYEYRRMVSLRVTWLILGVSTLMVVLITFAFASFINEVSPPGSDKPANAEAIIVAVTRAPFAPMGAGLIGILSMGNEFRHRTVITTLLVTPNRTLVLASKAVSVSVVSIIIAVLALTLGTITCMGVIGTAHTGLELGLTGRAFAGFVVLVAGWGLLGLGTATLIRSQAGAILILIGFATVVEPLLNSILTMSNVQVLDQAAGFLPFTAASSMIATSAGALSATVGEASASLEPWAGGLVYSVFVALVLLLAGRSFSRSQHGS